MDLDLRNPRTLDLLLRRTAQTIESSSRPESDQVSLGMITHPPLVPMAEDSIKSRYVRDALRVYRQIDSMA